MYEIKVNRSSTNQKAQLVIYWMIGFIFIILLQAAWVSTMYISLMHNDIYIGVKYRNNFQAKFKNIDLVFGKFDINKNDNMHKSSVN